MNTPLNLNKKQKHITQLFMSEHQTPIIHQLDLINLKLIQLLHL